MDNCRTRVTEIIPESLSICIQEERGGNNGALTLTKKEEKASKVGRTAERKQWGEMETQSQTISLYFLCIYPVSNVTKPLSTFYLIWAIFKNAKS